MANKRGWVKTEEGWEPLDPRVQQIVFRLNPLDQNYVKQTVVM